MTGEIVVHGYDLESKVGTVAMASLSPLLLYLYRDEIAGDPVPIQVLSVAVVMLFGLFVAAQAFLGRTTVDPTDRTVSTRLFLRKGSISFDDIVEMKLNRGRMGLRLADGVKGNCFYRPGEHVCFIIPGTSTMPKIRTIARMVKVPVPPSMWFNRTGEL